MVRTFRRKTTPVDKEQLKKAVLVRKDKMSVSAAAKQFDVRRTTLNDWLKKNNDEIENLDDVVVLHKGHISVMDSEKTLVEYLVHCNDMYLGLSAKETRGFAFDLTKKLNLKVPASWEAARMAGEDWLERHLILSIRKPETTSLARATSFNRTNVESSLRC
ncbi:uncharacterized protein [Temnothorax longispinosus]|uniref:uncharacterized protein n=1 Tax=Temnothorax longispinosus TaxID=300112 RepID=UPI003A99C5A8